MIETNIQQILGSIPDIMEVVLKSKNLTEGSPIKDLRFEISSRNGIYELIFTYYSESQTMSINVDTVGHNVQIALDPIYQIKPSVLAEFNSLKS